MSKTCFQCCSDFPDHLIQRLVCNGKAESICPLCALTDRNFFHRRPRSEPFSGPIARKMFVEACEHLKGNGQAISKDMRQALAAIEEKGL